MSSEYLAHAHGSRRAGAPSMNESTIRPSETNDEYDNTSASQLVEIQRELEELRERRRQLEQQRSRLLQPASHGSSPMALSNTSRDAPPLNAPRAPAEGGHRHYGAGRPPIATPRLSRDQSASQHLNRPNSSRRLSSCASSSTIQHHHHSSSEFDPILPEAERRRQLQHSVYYEMKEAMRRSWNTDSTLVGGSFQAEDCSRVSTFGRERRFLPLTGLKGAYFLASDFTQMQQSRGAEKAGPTRLVASSRGQKGANIHGGWNTSRSGTAPGPGAYTPRYQKASKPSIRAQRL